MYICIDLDAFFVSVEQALDPSLLYKPVIVGGLPQERGVVASASYEARKFGIHSGMPTSLAYRLCPRAIFLRGNFQHYRLYSNRFYEIISSYSPEVDMVSIDEAYINTTGTQRLFGPPLELAYKMKNEIKETLNIPSSIGIARTRVFSKIACEQSKPNGTIAVPQKDEIPFLTPLGVNVLPGIGPKNVAVLKNLNITTVQELIKTPDWILETALGSYYKILKFFIQGGDYQCSDTMKSISRETTLHEDTLNRNLIYALLYYLTERACSTLRKNKLLAKTVTVKTRFSDFKTISRRTKIPAGNAQQIIFELSARILEEILKEKKRIRLIGIALSGFEYDGLQSSMFMLKEERLNRLNGALDRARNKFGFNTLFAANTTVLKKHFKDSDHGYTLHTPSLSQ
ncbi:MAG: DNA polymerase IV [candidate division WOR-3 bacterium]|nr:DNA polymerase IV [candidate division WOR-3 bacterium]